MPEPPASGSGAEPTPQSRPSTSQVTTTKADDQPRLQTAPAILALLQAAGECPIIESERSGSPCRQYCKLGLEIQEVQGRRYQWVTTLGWGDPSSELYIVGTTPRFHSVEERWGPNYAEVGIDREAHAAWFALEGFETFQKQAASRLARTTHFQRRLIDAWFGAHSRSARAFVTELMLCPQTVDPVGLKGLAAMRYCFGQNLLKLLQLSTEPKWLVTIGAKHAEVLSETLKAPLPRPTRRTPVTSANLMASHNAYWIGVVSPAGGGGGPWDDVIASVLEHGKALRSSPAILRDPQR